MKSQEKKDGIRYIVVFTNLVIVVILDVYKEYMLGVWIGWVTLLRNNRDWRYGQYYISVIERYPYNSGIKPMKNKALFPYYKNQDKGIPKEIFYPVVVEDWYEKIGSFLIVILRMYGIDPIIGAGIVTWSVIIKETISIVLMMECNRKCYIEKYKVTTFHNLKYFFIENSIFLKNIPRREFIGRCELISIDKIKKNIYVTVKMSDTGEIIHKVIAEKAVIEKNREKGYLMYRIVDVNYIV